MHEAANKCHLSECPFLGWSTCPQKHQSWSNTHVFWLWEEVRVSRENPHMLTAMQIKESSEKLKESTNM